MVIKDIYGKLKLVKKDRVFFKPCIICGGAGVEEHHLVPNRAYRPICERLGLTAMLCSRCHNLTHTKGSAAGLYLKLKQIAQKVFEKYIGTHDEWMELFHKDYL